MAELLQTGGLVMGHRPVNSKGDFATVSGYRILLVDDDADERGTFKRELERAGLMSVEAPSVSAALEIANHDPPPVDAIVVDVVMAAADGFDWLRQVAREAATRATPILVRAPAFADERAVIKALRFGATDVIAKTVSSGLLKAKLVGICQRAREERELRSRLARALEHSRVDHLTGLLNRETLSERLLDEAVVASRRRKSFAVAILDLDRFKVLNDTYGHLEGDRALVHFANALRSVLRADDAAFRHGGEEFLIVLRACDAERARRVLRRLREQLVHGPFLIRGTSRVLTFSGGIAVCEAEEVPSPDGLHRLLASADAALYEAKAAGRDCVCVAL